MSSANENLSGPIIIGLGEALFDCFPDRQQLGGAPVNLAVHAGALVSRLGGQGLIATAVGDDALGKTFLSLIDEHQVSDELVQIDSQHPTGRVDVQVDGDGQPTYEFQSDVAWDYLAFTEAWQQAASSASAVCFGTLAQRCEASQKSIRQFLTTAEQAFKLFDVNLRQDFYSAEVLRGSFELASAAKLNNEELPIVLELLGLAGNETESMDRAAQALIETFDLAWVAVTRGRQGTALYAEGECYTSEVPQFERHPNADSVGAGDACGAGLLASQLLSWSYADRVALANQMGAFVASQPGATPHLPESVFAKLQ
ncbi:aminoimidazole riboside kinase [Aeoliella mucimassa]|uniref:Aminoimidazole riboside kinase n=2 Tax=Aeoliella mucimassa TaxID=2527972 RepID=A0A518ASA1_9BACT|nr:aminoimidazole riboside kinase [Aeoliella mucimassa]